MLVAYLSHTQEKNVVEIGQRAQTLRWSVLDRECRVVGLTNFEAVEIDKTTASVTGMLWRTWLHC